MTSALLLRLRLALLLWAGSLPLLAQTVRVQPGVQLRSEAGTRGDFFALFPNVNRVDLFRDRDLRYDIDEAEADRDTNKLDRLLSLYVRNFGILNFRQDQDLQYVWRLAQLKMARRDTAKALYFFSLALKNLGEAAPNRIRQAFDTLRSARRNPWVDLDLYYRMVAKRRKIDTLIPPQGVLLNMGKRINGPAPDYAPYMHPSGSVLLFTSRRRDWETVGADQAQNEDIYFAQTSLFGEGWEPAQPFQDVINSPYNEGSACLNPSATELYFTRCNAPDGQGVCDLYMAEWKDGQWVNVRNLGPEVNSSDWDSHPALSPDGNTMFFASNRKNGFGRTDIWMSRRLEGGGWGQAQNLGPVVNTIEDEVTPFLHPVNNTLYFSTKGHLNNFGGFDIVKSRWMGNHWEEPRNLGPLVNTRGDEYYFSLDGRGERLYYAMAQPGRPKDLDLYSFRMPMEARPDAITKLSGYLIDSVSGNPITGMVAAIDQDLGTEIAPLKISPTGYFEFQLVADRRYTLLLLGDNALNIASTVNLTEDTLTTIFGKALDLNKPVVFRAINFRRNSTEVEKQALPAIGEIAEFLHDRPYVRITVRGHTDADGDPEFNRELSLTRALNIRKLLLEMSGAPDSSVVAQGYGDERPIRPNDNPANKAANRRVEFELFVPTRYRAEMGAVPLTVAVPGTDLPTPPAPKPAEPAVLPKPRVTTAPAAAADAAAAKAPGMPARPATTTSRPAAPAARPTGVSSPATTTASIKPAPTTTEPAAEDDVFDDDLDLADDDLLEDLGDDLGADVLADPELDELSAMDSDDLTGAVLDLLDEETPEKPADKPEEIDFSNPDEEVDLDDDDDGR